jgi:hypothetical protein
MTISRLDIAITRPHDGSTTTWRTSARPCDPHRPARAAHWTVLAKTLDSPPPRSVVHGRAASVRTERLRGATLATGNLRLHGDNKPLRAPWTQPQWRFQAHPARHRPTTPSPAPAPAPNPASRATSQRHRNRKGPAARASTPCIAPRGPSAWKLSESCAVKPAMLPSPTERSPHRLILSVRGDALAMPPDSGTVPREPTPLARPWQVLRNHLEPLATPAPCRTLRNTRGAPAGCQAHSKEAQPAYDG